MTDSKVLIDLFGSTVKAAEEVMEAKGYQVRVVMLDDIPCDGEAGYEVDRVNLVVNKNWIVTSAFFG